MVKLDFKQLSTEQKGSLFEAMLLDQQWAIPAKAIVQQSEGDSATITPMIKLPTLYRGVHTQSAELADLVGDLQKFLLGLDYQIAVDEDFGPKTKAVVQQYQRSKGIADDGKVGPTTWGYLFADGFRPKEFEDDENAYQIDDPKHSPNWPPRPAGMRAPNGFGLFGKDFTYTPKPLKTMPEYVVADPGWVRANIKRVEIPQLIGVHGAPATGLVYINRQIEEQFVAFFGVLEQLDLLDRVLTWSGSWVTRFVRGRTDRLSNHSFGTAFDINAAWNVFRKQPALVGRRGSVREIVPIAFQLGFFWGGWYNDGMHFEAYKAMSTEDVAKVIEQLIREHGAEHVD